MVSQRKVTRKTKQQSGNAPTVHPKGAQWGESYGINRITLTELNESWHERFKKIR